MSRWKPAQPKSSPYITVTGFQQLQLELKQLWEKRKEVTKALAAAAAEGDRSENAEYIYRKKELRGIDRRIHYLQKRMPALKVVTEKPANQNQIFFGAWVVLEKLDGEQISFRIVGADEIDTEKKYVSVDSPLAKMLLKKKIDDEVVFRNEFTTTHYYVVDIKY